jgi:hypothetical protein
MENLIVIVESKRGENHEKLSVLLIVTMLFTLSPISQYHVGHAEEYSSFECCALECDVENDTTRTPAIYVFCTTCRATTPFDLCGICGRLNPNAYRCRICRNPCGHQ